MGNRVLRRLVRNPADGHLGHPDRNAVPGPEILQHRHPQTPLHHPVPLELFATRSLLHSVRAERHSDDGDRYEQPRALLLCPPCSATHFGEMGNYSEHGEEFEGSACVERLAAEFCGVAEVLSIDSVGGVYYQCCPATGCWLPQQCLQGIGLLSLLTAMEKLLAVKGDRFQQIRRKVVWKSVRLKIELSVVFDSHESGYSCHFSTPLDADCFRIGPVLVRSVTSRHRWAGGVQIPNELLVLLSSLGFFQLDSGTVCENVGF